MTRDEFLTDAQDFTRPSDVTKEHLVEYYKLLGYVSDEKRKDILGKLPCWCLGIKLKEGWNEAIAEFEKTGKATLPIGVEMYKLKETSKRKEYWKQLIPDNKPVDECIAIIKDLLGIDLQLPPNHRKEFSDGIQSSYK